MTVPEADYVPESYTPEQKLRAKVARLHTDINHHQKTLEKTKTMLASLKEELAEANAALEETIKEDSEDATDRTS